MTIGNVPGHDQVTLIQRVMDRPEAAPAALLPPAQDRLSSAGPEAQPPAPSFAARAKQGILNFLGWVYKAFSNCPSLEEACTQGNIWLIRGFAFLQNLSKQTLQQSLDAAYKAGKWVVVEYFAECFGCFSLDNANLTPLHMLIRNNKQAAALQLIPLLPDEALKVAYLQPDRQAITPLHAAVMKEQPAVVKALVQRDEKAAQELLSKLSADPTTSADEIEVLIQAGVSLSAVDKNGQQPIHRASMCGNKAALQCFLNHGVSIHTPDSNHGYTPLHFAILSSQVETATLLLDKGAKNIPSKHGFTPLISAYEQNLPMELCHRLLEMSANPAEEKDIVGKTLLEYMIEREDYKGINALAGKGVDISPLLSKISIESENGFVLQAYKSGFLNIVNAFVQQGRGLQAADDFGRKLIHLAAKDDRGELMKLLREKGANIHEDAPYAGGTPFQIALREGRLSIALDLVKDTGANFTDFKTLDNDFFRAFVTDGVERKIFTPQQFLNAAIQRGDLALVKILVEKGADPLEYGKKTLKTPLHKAAQLDVSGAVVQYLVAELHKKRGRVDFLHQVDGQGNTPLHLAAAAGHAPAVAAILKLLPPEAAEAPNGAGKTALQLAKAGKHAGIVKLLTPQEAGEKAPNRTEQALKSAIGFVHKLRNKKGE